MLTFNLQEEINNAFNHSAGIRVRVSLFSLAQYRCTELVAGLGRAGLLLPEPASRERGVGVTF